MGRLFFWVMDYQCLITQTLEKGMFKTYVII